MSQTLRPYQVAALEGLREEIRAGHRRSLLVSPTGSGKTTIAAAMIEGVVSRSKRALFLAHRRELIDQCSARLDGCGIAHGVIMAGHRRYQPLFPVQIASVQTLARRAKPAADLIIVDEAHHARAGTYEGILQAYPTQPVIGLSATPWRTDGRGLGELFEGLVCAATIADLTRDGYLVPVTGYAYDAPDLAKARRRGQDYDAGDLELLMGGSAIAGNVIQAYLEHARGKRAVLFAVSVKHSQDLAERFRAAGVPAEHVDGETPVTERAAILRRLADGTTHVVCNVGVLTEGWDLPACEVCILARPTLSVGLYMQMVGRVLRPAPGKTVARIHDHAGCVMMHGRPDAERDYSLSSDVRVSKKKKAAPVVPLRACEQCYRMYEATEEKCPECGHPNRRRVRPPPREVAPTEAVRIEDIRQVPLADRRAYWESLEQRRVSKGYKPGWTGYRYKLRFGMWPPWRSLTAPAPVNDFLSALTEDLGAHG